MANLSLIIIFCGPKIEDISSPVLLSEPEQMNKMISLFLKHRSRLRTLIIYLYTNWGYLAALHLPRNFKVRKRFIYCKANEGTYSLSRAAESLLSLFPPLKCCRVVLLHPVIQWTAGWCFIIKQESCSCRKILVVQILIALLKDHLWKKKPQYMKLISYCI